MNWFEYRINFLEDLCQERNTKVLELTAELEAKNKQIAELEAKLAESEKKHLLDEVEWQNYCSFKHIEPQIKGCLDREKQLKQQLAEKEKEIEEMQKNVVVLVKNKEIMNLESIRNFINEEIEIENDLSALRLSEFLNTKIEKAKSSEILQGHNQDKISFCIEQLTELRDYVKECWGLDELEGKVRLDIAKKIRLKIEELKKEK